MGICKTQQLFSKPSFIDHPPERFGAAPAHSPAKFMLAAAGDVDGGWAYQRECSGYFGWTRITERLERTAEGGGEITGGESSVRWWRLEFKAPDTELPLPAWLILAGHPYAGGWAHGLAPDPGAGSGAMVGMSRFKAGSKRGVGRRPDLASRPHNSAVEAIRWIESHEFDFWDRDPRRLTAGVPEPALPMAPNPRSRIAWKHELLVMGVCQDPATCYRDLANSEKASALVDMTVRGTLRPFYRSEDNRSLDQLRLRNDLRNEADAWTTLHLSIMQAMAGPHKDSEAWIGRPLIEKVDHIYCGHMNNLNRAG